MRIKQLRFVMQESTTTNRPILQTREVSVDCPAAKGVVDPTKWQSVEVVYSDAEYAEALLQASKTTTKESGQ